MDLEYYLSGDTKGLGEVGAHGYDPYSDVGWFGSGLMKKIGGAVKSAVKAVKSAPIGIVSGQWVTNAIMKKVFGDKLYNSVIPQQYRSAVDALNSFGAKKPAEVLPTMIAGASPKGIERGLQIAGDLGLGNALGAQAANFTKGTQSAMAFDVGKKLMMTKGVSKEALAAARTNLGNEAQKRAFDVAVGTAAKYADQLKLPRVSPKMSAAFKRQSIISGTRGPRPMNTLPPPQFRRLPSVVSAPVRLALNQIGRTGGSPAAIAKLYGAPQGALSNALTRGGFMPRVSWEGLSPAGASFVQRHVAHAPFAALRGMAGDTRGLVEDGKVYVVEPGDNPSKIAKKLTGDPNRFRELHSANPNKKIATSGPFKGSFAQLFAGERLIVPVSWRPKAVPGPLTTTLPEVVIPGKAPPSGQSTSALTAAIIQAKALLVTWSKTDGLGEAGPTDYGARPEDMSTTFGPRDKLVGMAFESWSNRKRGTKLLADGEMNAELSEALRSWAESRSALPVPSSSPPVTPSQPTPPAASPPVAPPVAIPFPSVPPLVATPATPPALPFPPLPPVAATPPAATAPPASPFPATPAAPATPASKSSDGSDVFLPIAAGAAGGMLFGPVGLVAGAVLGLAASAKSA